MSVTRRADSGEPESDRLTRHAFRGRSTTRRIESWWFPCIVATISASVVFWIVQGGLIDDSYITLTYARNLAADFQWGMVPGEVANSATSPLNVLVLAAMTWLLQFVVGIQPVAALGVVFVVANVVLVDALRRVAIASGLPSRHGVLGAGLVLFNPLLLSAVGLEMTLVSMLIALLLLATLRDQPGAFGVVAGLLVLARIDTGIFALVLWVGRPALWRGWWKTLLAGCAVTLPWFAFSWLVLGSVVPDTLLIKQLQDYWGDRVFSNGLFLYLAKYPVAMTLSLAAPVLAVLALPFRLLRSIRIPEARRWDAAVLVGIAGIAHYLAYTMLGVPPYHWYYGPSIIGLSVSLALLFPMTDHLARSVTAMTCGGIVLIHMVFLVQQELPWDEAPITTNGATSGEYARMGRELGRLVGDATVSSPGEIGALAFYCHCAIVDEFSDRGYLPAKIDQRERQVGPFLRWLIDLNYTHFDRTQQPRAIQFDLRRVEGFGKNPLWNGDSAYHEPAHFVLSPR